MKPDRCANRQTDSSSTQRRRGGLQRDVRECVNPHGVAFPLWISVRLNFSRVGWQGAIGHSVNVSGSEQPEPRQPCAVACHSHSSLSILLFFVSVWELFIFLSFPILCYPTHPLPLTFIIVFYLCLAIACRNIADPVIDMAGFCFFVFLFSHPFLDFCSA